MANGDKKMQSWQVLHFARKHLGRSVLYAIFGKKNARTVDYWCEDPRYTGKEDRAFDPIQGVKDLLDALDDQGHTPIVRACLNFLRSGTSLEEEKLPMVSELLPTLAEEKLADYIALAEFQSAIERCRPYEEANALKKAAIEEIERTFAKYVKDCGHHKPEEQAA
ncbi:MAG: hypothetical protein WCZ86_03860 [Desulfurivibrionaceae bacterium]|jgi:hypothetical protein